jgi:hypothetical protein
MNVCFDLFTAHATDPLVSHQKIGPQSGQCFRVLLFSPRSLSHYFPAEEVGFQGKYGKIEWQIVATSEAARIADGRRVMLPRDPLIQLKQGSSSYASRHVDGSFAGEKVVYKWTYDFLAGSRMLEALQRTNALVLCLGMGKINPDASMFKGSKVPDLKTLDAAAGKIEWPVSVGCFTKLNSLEIKRGVIIHRAVYPLVLHVRQTLPEIMFLASLEPQVYSNYLRQFLEGRSLEEASSNVTLLTSLKAFGSLVHYLNSFKDFIEKGRELNMYASTVTSFLSTIYRKPKIRITIKSYYEHTLLPMFSKEVHVLTKEEANRLQDSKRYAATFQYHPISPPEPFDLKKPYRTSRCNVVRVYFDTKGLCGNRQSNGQT